MKPHKLTDSMIQDYGKNLFEEEKSKATIDKYLRDIRSFYAVSYTHLDVYKRQVLR